MHNPRYVFVRACVQLHSLAAFLRGIRRAQYADFAIRAMVDWQAVFQAIFVAGHQRKCNWFSIEIPSEAGGQQYTIQNAVAAMNSFLAEIQDSLQQIDFTAFTERAKSAFVFIQALITKISPFEVAHLAALFDLMFYVDRFCTSAEDRHINRHD